MDAPNRQVARSNASGLPSRRQKILCGREEFAEAMLTLCALKLSAQLTAIQMKAWYSVLCGFQAHVISTAVVEISLTETRFPEVGDLYQICRKTLPASKREATYCPNGTGPKVERGVTTKEVREIAQRLGLPVELEK